MANRSFPDTDIVFVTVVIVLIVVVVDDSVTLAFNL